MNIFDISSNLYNKTFNQVIEEIKAFSEKNQNIKYKINSNTILITGDDFNFSFSIDEKTNKNTNKTTINDDFLEQLRKECEEKQKTFSKLQQEMQDREYEILNRYKVNLNNIHASYTTKTDKSEEFKTNTSGTTNYSKTNLYQIPDYHNLNQIKEIKVPLKPISR